jgi:hypothetical protein
MTSDLAAGELGSADQLELGDLAAYARRPLGTSVGDLAIDLSEPIDSDQVTAVLAACLTDASGRPASIELLRAAPVGDRTATVMAIAAALSDGRFTIPLVCPVASCGDAIEIVITWDEVRSVARQTTREPFDVNAASVRYRVRRASAADQESWRSLAAGNAKATARDVVASLVVDGPIDRLTPSRVAVLEAALDEHDPLVCFALDVRCPTCGEVSRQEPALVSIAATLFRRAQAGLLEDVHEIASAYGWTEPEILAIPAWRRVRYRSRIEARH